jgi:hypothetical protein
MINSQLYSFFTLSVVVAKSGKMVMNDLRITIRKVADEVGIPIGSCYNIFSNVLGMKRVAAKFFRKNENSGYFF